MIQIEIRVSTFLKQPYCYILGVSKKMSVSNKEAFLTNGHFFDSPCNVHSELFIQHIQR